MTTFLKIFAVTVLAVTTVFAVTSFWNDSVIVDEVPHIGAGYSYLVKQDMRLNPEHPPLAKDLAALPLLFLNVNRGAFGSNFWLTDINGQWEFGRRLIFGSGNDAELMTRLVKLPMLLFFLLSAMLVFRWTFRLYGPAGGAVALILFAFSPTVLAHSRFVTTDMAATFGILFATYFFTRYLRHPTRKAFWAAVLVAGVALLTKFSVFLLIPYLTVLAVTWGLLNGGPRLAWTRLLRSALILAAGFAIVVWPVYYFHTYNYPAERQKTDTAEQLSSFGNRYLAETVIWLSDKPVLRAAGHYGLGLLMVVQRSAGGNTIYFLNKVTKSGGPVYFPLVYFLKEPLAWWGLVLIALWAASVRFRSAALKLRSLEEWIKNHFEEFAMLLWLAVYWFTSIRSNLNIGVRHLLPTYPFAIMLVSGQISYLAGYLRVLDVKKFKAVTAGIAVLIAWYAFESMNVHPFYLTYFNQLAGGPSGGYRYVTDSNLDWGQDLKRFSEWVKNKKIEKIEFDYFGWADPRYYLEDRYVWLSSTKYTGTADFIARNESDGWLAVSATFLQGSKGPPGEEQPVNYENWLWRHEPIAVIGNSIFVYRIK